jgi:hypothetical protein
VITVFGEIIGFRKRHQSHRRSVNSGASDAVNDGTRDDRSLLLPTQRQSAEQQQD